MKQQFLVNTADTFKTYIYENNRKIAPSSASLTVYRAASDSRLIDNAAMTVGADGLLSYGLSESDNAFVGLNYKVSISYMYGSKTYYATLFYDVVRSRLQKVVTDDDITAELPQLKDAGWSAMGSADSGLATTIVDAELKRYEDGYFTGGLAVSLSKDETREITDFRSTTGTVTTAAFSSAVAAGENYVLIRSFSREIQRAFEKMEDKLQRLGKRPELILDPYDMREPHIFYATAEACKGLAMAKDNFWWEMWKEYERKADEAFDGITFKYDATSDGYLSPGEEGTRLESMRAIRG